MNIVKTMFYNKIKDEFLINFLMFYIQGRSAHRDIIDNHCEPM
jgi:hypothetical protein